MAIVESADIEAAVRGIGDISTLADGPGTVRRLRALANNEDLPLPAREAAIDRFTRSLAYLPRDAVAPEIMHYLRHFEPRTLIPHEDHRGAEVPLFNIRGLAAGMENRWRSAEFSAEAHRYIGTEPEKILAAFAAGSDPNRRSGYLNALRQANAADVLAVQDAALQRLPDNPALTPLVGLTALRTAEPEAARQLLINGRGAGFAATLNVLGRQLPATDIAALLAFAIERAPSDNASLAIGAWWPLLKHDPAIRDRVLDLLADPGLGSSAALALAKDPDILTIRSLQEIAAGEGDAARRARMALEFNRAGLAGGARP